MSGSRDNLRNSTPTHLGDTSRITLSSPFAENYAAQIRGHSQSQSLIYDRVESSPSRSVASTTAYSLNENLDVPSTSFSRNLNDEMVQTKKLEKDNFDMKMKIFYLEEQLQRYQGDGMDGTGANSNDLNELSADNMSLRIQVEETGIELEQRNTLLIKAKSAIETLKKEIERLQQEVQHSHKREFDLRQQLSTVTSASSFSSAKAERDVHLTDSFLDTSSHEELVQQLKQQLQMSREATRAKDDALVSCREELAETKLSLDHYGAVNNELQNDKTRLAERLRELSRRHEELDKEIVVSRTSVDFNSLQMNEKDRYIERLQDVIEKFEQDTKEYEQEKMDLSRAEQRNLDGLKKVHEREVQDLEAALQAQEESYKDDIDKLIHQHAQELELCVQEGRLAVEKITAQHSALLSQLKSDGAGETYKQREALNERVFEKEAEILRLRGVLDLERSHVEAHKSTIEELKRQLSTHSSHLEGSSAERAEAQRKHESLARDLESALADGRRFETVVDSLNLELQRDREASEGLRGSLREARSTITSLETQVDMLRSESEVLRKWTGGVEDTSRENERLKSLVQAAKEDIVDMTTERDQATMREKITREESLKKDELITAASAEVRRLVAKLEHVTDELQECEQQLQAERTSVTRLEATVREQREVVTRDKRDVEELRADLLAAERRISAESFTSQSSRASFEKSCSRLLTAAMRWDAALAPVLEGADSQGRPGAGSGQDPSRLVDDMLQNPDDLFQNSVAVIERVQYKLDRILKIREMFGKATQRMFAEADTKVGSAQDKVSLMSYRVKDLEDKARRIGSDIEKDTKRKELNSLEMKSFQHTIVSEHVHELKEAEERASNLTAQLKAEMQRSEALERDVLLLRDENAALESERYELSQTENTVSQLSGKFQTMAESNRLMSLEIEERGQTIIKNNDAIQALKSEKNALLAGVQRLTSQIEMRDQMMSDHEGKLAGLQTEIRQLKSRQINPDLEKSILESQNILRSSISNFSGRVPEKESAYFDHVDADESALTSHFLSDNAVSSAIQTMFAKLSSFVGTVSALSKDSEQMLRKFESIQSGQDSSSSVEHDMFELLDANSRLTSKLLQLAIDFKRLSRKVLLQSTDEAQQFGEEPTHSPPASRGKFTYSEDRRGVDRDVDRDLSGSVRGAALGLDALSGSYDSPLRLGESAYTPLRPQSRSQHRSSEHQALHRSSSSTGGHQATGSSMHRPIASSPVSPTNFRKYPPPQSVTFADSHSRLSFESQSRNHGSQLTRSSSSQQPQHSHHSQHHSSQEHQSHHPSQRFGFQQQSGLTSPRYSSFAASSSPSGSRLSRLGSDLQNLAGKLDTFNANTRSSSKVSRN